MTVRSSHIRAHSFVRSKVVKASRFEGLCIARSKQEMALERSSNVANKSGEKMKLTVDGETTND